MKKIIAALSALALVFSLCACGEKEPEVKGIKVFAAISSEGQLSLAKEVTAVDVDGDGVCTVDEALYSAHEQYFEGKAQAGYASENTDYGISLTKLWGVENGVYGYGYYLNNASPESLLDEVKEGDFIAAYSYKDLAGWSDVYSYFDKAEYETADGKVDIVLSFMSFDENWAPAAAPLEGAVIYIDGAASEFKTDAEGKAQISLSGKGEHVISAQSDAMLLVPAAALVTVK